MRNKLLAHIVDREDFRDHVYEDSLGFPTGGIGHKLTDAENKLYPVGTSLPKRLTDNWLREDMSWAEQAAIDQSSQIPDSTPDFQDALTSVNFQLGPNWIAKFPTAWKHMKKGDYGRAISEIEYTEEGSGVPSLWAKQTPDRVGDFVSALTTLNEESENMAHNRKHRRDNRVTQKEELPEFFKRDPEGESGMVDDYLEGRKAFMKEHRQVPDYFKRDPEGESRMVPDYLEGRQEVLDSVGLPNESEYLDWASKNRDMIAKFFSAMVKDNNHPTAEAAKGGRNNRQNPTGSDKGLDFGGMWDNGEKGTGLSGRNSRGQKGNRDSQGNLMTPEQEASMAPVRDLSRMGDKIQYEDRPDREGGNAPVRDLSTGDDDWGMSDWSSWFSDLLGSK